MRFRLQRFRSFDQLARIRDASEMAEYTSLRVHVLVTYSANYTITNYDYTSLLMWRNCFSSKVNPIIIHLITFTLVFSDNTVKEEEITVNEKVSDWVTKRCQWNTAVHKSARVHQHKMTSGVANLRRSMLVYISQSKGKQTLFLTLDLSPLKSFKFKPLGSSIWS